MAMARNESLALRIEVLALVAARQRMLELACRTTRERLAGQLSIGIPLMTSHLTCTWLLLLLLLVETLRIALQRYERSHVRRLLRPLLLLLSSIWLRVGAVE